ncbi:hypothetical protein AB5N19_03181 [Seiridium cardinale]
MNPSPTVSMYGGQPDCYMGFEGDHAAGYNDSALTSYNPIPMNQQGTIEHRNDSCESTGREEYIVHQEEPHGWGLTDQMMAEPEEMPFEYLFDFDLYDMSGNDQASGPKKRKSKQGSSATRSGNSNSESRKHRCTCGKSFARSTDLRRHQTGLKGCAPNLGNRYKCAHCKQLFCRKDHMLRQGRNTCKIRKRLSE